MKRPRQYQGEGYVLIVRPEENSENEPPTCIAVYQKEDDAERAMGKQKIKEMEHFLNYIYYPDYILVNCRNQPEAPPHELVQKEIREEDEDEDNSFGDEWKWVKFCERYTTWTRKKDDTGEERWIYEIDQSAIEDVGLDKLFRKTFHIIDENYGVIVEIHKVQIL